VSSFIDTIVHGTHYYFLQEALRQRTVCFLKDLLVLVLRWPINLQDQTGQSDGCFFWCNTLLHFLAFSCMRLNIEVTSSDSAGQARGRASCQLDRPQPRVELCRRIEVRPCSSEGFIL